MFKDPFSFDDRIRRTEYIISFIIAVILMFIIQVITNSNRNLEILYLGYIPILWFLWAQGAKRSHDIGNSGWWQVIPFYALWLFFEKGEVGTNQYGNDPKDLVDLNKTRPIHHTNKPVEDYNKNFTDEKFDGKNLQKNSSGAFELFVLLALPAACIIYIVIICNKY